MPKPLAITVRYAEELLHLPPPPPPPAPPSQCVHMQESFSPANSIARLSCEGVSRTSTIKAVVFASFGTATGSCIDPGSSSSNTFKMGSCNAYNTSSVVQKLCLGKSSCEVPSSIKVFGEPCHHVHKWLDIAVQCSENEHRDAAVAASLTAEPPVSSLVHTPALECVQRTVVTAVAGVNRLIASGQDQVRTKHARQMRRILLADHVLTCVPARDTRTSG